MDAVRRRIAVIGSGISGLSCAWLLARQHEVTLFEAADRAGGHSNTVTIDDADAAFGVDTGFIVYNERTYPNLTALFAHLEIPTHPADMSLSVARGGGRDFLEYSGSDLGGLFAQKRNLLRPRFWSMLRHTARFYRAAQALSAEVAGSDETLGALLDRHGYGRAMQEDHVLPMAAAIWSCAPDDVRDQPAEGFLRFCLNHGLLQLRDRPQWHSVRGGSRVYVEAMLAAFQRNQGARLRLQTPVRAVERGADGVMVHTGQEASRFDDVVLATHAPCTLALLADATPAERSVLGTFRYGDNLAVLHEDTGFMPKARRAWASWNVREGSAGGHPSVTYWMNALQSLPTRRNLFVTLNPDAPVSGEIARFHYDHPLFDTAASQAQARLSSIQGVQRTWYCGAYFGAGFHEDGLQAGLAVAEHLGGVRRPWEVRDESARLPRGPFSVERNAA